MPKSAHVFGVHMRPPSGPRPLLPPHSLGVPPPPQVCGSVQVAQVRMPPQPSPCWPQTVKPSFALMAAHVVGVQIGPPSGPRPLLPPHTLGPPPPQN